MSNLTGQSLGRYHILEQLGEGGMATVYQAYDTRLETDVAVKVIRTDILPQNAIERTLKRFEREAKALAKLTHPNIVPVMDYGEFAGQPYLVMKYLPGGTLKQLFNGKLITWQNAVHLLIPIAQALDYAHRQGLIHRDVKPANILITADGAPMLSDFGIAKIIEMEEGQTLTGTGVGIGTPEYMAPEQGMGREVDARADIYSLGIIFYELITGHKPYTADTPMAVILKHMTDPLPRPRQFVPALPYAVEQLLIKALAKNRKDRYLNAGAFAHAMETLIGEKPQLVPVSGNHATAPKDTFETNRQTVTMDTLKTYEQTTSETNTSQKPPAGLTSTFVSIPSKPTPASSDKALKMIFWSGLGLIVICLIVVSPLSESLWQTSVASPIIPETLAATEVLGGLLLPSAASPAQDATEAPPTVTEVPTYTPYPTLLPLPTYTPYLNQEQPVQSPQIPTTQAPILPTTVIPTQSPIPSVYPLGDLNHDYAVNCADLDLLKPSYRSVIGDLNYNPEADFDTNGVIDQFDAMTLGMNMTEASPPDGCP